MWVDDDCTQTCQCKNGSDLQCSQLECHPWAECSSKDGIRGCMCMDGFLGDGLNCTGTCTYSLIACIVNTLYIRTFGLTPILITTDLFSIMNPTYQILILYTKQAYAKVLISSPINFVKVEMGFNLLNE